MVYHTSVSSCSQPTNRPTSQRTNQHQLTNEPTDKHQPTHQRINESTNQPTYQPTNQPHQPTTPTPTNQPQPSDSLKDLSDVLALEGGHGLQVLEALLLLGGHDHGPHGRDALRGEEHVLRAAQPNPLGAEAAGGVGLLGGVGVGQDLPHGVIPAREGYGGERDKDNR